MNRLRLHVTVCAGLLCSFLSLPSDATQGLDQLVEKILVAVVDGDTDTALAASERMVELYPDYQLGQLLHAENLSLRALSSPMIGSTRPYSEKALGLLLEAGKRLQQSRHLPGSTTGVHTSPELNDRFPGLMIQSGHSVDDVLLVDLDLSRLYRYQKDSRSRMVLRDVLYISSGSGGAGKRIEGDLMSPVGIYRIDGFRADAELPALYGSGALTLDYPNIIDRYSGRTGSGIWLHGMPKHQLARPPLSSEGCIVMPNPKLTELHHQLDPAATLVVLTDGVSWPSTSERKAKRETFNRLFREYQALRTGQPVNSEIISAQSSRHANFPADSLRAVAAESVTILEYPKQPIAARGEWAQSLSGPERAQIMMQFPMKQKEFEIQITLFWKQTETGAWHLTIETTDTVLKKTPRQFLQPQKASP